MTLRIRKMGVALATAVVAFFVTAGTLAQASAAEQIVFSGQTPPGSFSVPFGFWVWCEDAEAGNPYEGSCAGSVYFYALGLIRHVRGDVSENADETYTMALASSDGAIACSLTNMGEPSSGPTNDVSVSCSAPAVSGTFHGAVVRVTGPGD